MNKKKRYFIVAVVLAAVVFGLYWNILDNEATNWDDPALFKRTAIHDITVENLKKVLSFDGGATYQPIRDLTYMIDFELWGVDASNVTFGMHLHSIALYLLMVLACWLFLLELFKAFTDDHEFCFIWASISSVIFAVHPVHVESVAWLYARKEPLLGLFTFISLWAFVRARTFHWKYYLISLISLLLAVLSKPTAVMIPAVMFVIDLALQSHQRQPSFWKKRLMLYLPMLMVAVPIVIRLLGVMFEVGGVKPYHGGSFWTNLLAVSQILVNYLGLIGFTINYSADYPLTLYADIHAWQAWLFVVLNILLIASGVAGYLMKRYVYAIFVAWFYLFLLPVSHIFPISQIMADRYALLSSLSWCVLLGFGLSRLWCWRLSSGKLSPEFPLLVACALLFVVAASYSYMTYERNDIWQDSQTLWEDTLAKYPDSSPANVNLSAIYLEQRRFRDVQELCLAAIKAKPYDYLAISNLALAQVMMKQYDNAINNYKQALKLKSDLPKSEMGLAMAYWGKGDYENAYLLYSQLLREGKVPGPESLGTYFYRIGFSLWKLNRTEQAMEYLTRAEELARDNPFLLKDMGMAYNSMGDFVRAAQMFEEAIPKLQEGELKTKLSAILGLLKEKHDL